jgi:Fe-S-cluster-containing hydrogenase component 2
MPDLPAAAPVLDPLPLGREEESLFARDENDILVRREKETRERFKEEVTVVIDGYSVTLPRAVPKTDSQGNQLRDADGELIPRTTTIYDAALALVTAKVWTEETLKTRIPVLCHQRHVTPVAVCRMCSVHISSFKRGKLTPGRKLVPACQHRIEKGMVVTTRAGGGGYNPSAKEAADIASVDRFARDVNDSVRMLAEFLVADHHHPPIGEKRYEDELGAVAAALEVAAARKRLQRDPELPDRNHQFTTGNVRARRIPLPLAAASNDGETLDSRDAKQAWEDWNETVNEQYPYSSRTVVVDHDRCILCDRCARACSEVKPFQVIGHTGKGYNARISFDLDQIMGQSSCVQCGECMNSCPTGALSLRRRVQPRAWEDSPQRIPVNPNTQFTGSDFLTADEMKNVWVLHKSPTRGEQVYFPFRSIPYSYLKWNEGSVRRWEIAPGTQRVLCQQGEYGSTAFVLQGTGQFKIYEREPGAPTSAGFFGLFSKKSREEASLGKLVRTATGDELVLGEMTCLTQRPRTASVVAIAAPNNPQLALRENADGTSVVVKENAPGPVVVYEVTRNLLDMMQRSASERDNLKEMYTFRAIQTCVSSGRLFSSFSREDRERAIKFLLDSNPEYRRVEPGESIVAEGDQASAFHIIRLGTVRVYKTVAGRDQVLRLLSAGDYFGEGALLPGQSTTRSASVAALDPVELVRIPGPVFLRLCAAFPQLPEELRKAQRPAAPGVQGTPPPGMLTEFARQGLYQGQRMLVLDLKSCTRCDECTRACADSHDGNARLLREGLRFGDFLVATSCRSCHKPYCMEGCPVDAIHRRGEHLEVVIENHCIGCGLCEKNCPYGAIHMAPRNTLNPAAAAYPEGNPQLTAVRRAVNCDLCGGNEPFCVQACPHEAAYRMSGPDLLNEVLDRLNQSNQ